MGMEKNNIIYQIQVIDMQTKMLEIGVVRLKFRSEKGQK